MADTIDDYYPTTTLPDVPDVVYTLRYSPDGKQILAGLVNGEARVWDTHSHQLVQTYPLDVGTAADRSDERGLWGAAYRPDGQQIAFTNGSNIQIRNINGTPVITLTGHTGDVYSVAYSPEGKYLISGSCDQSTHLWDLAESSPTAIAILYGHTTLVRAIAYRPDGKAFASGSADTAIRRYPTLYEDVLALSKEYMPRGLTPEEREALLGR